MGSNEILELIITNLKNCDKYIIIRDQNNNIIFPRDIDSIKNIERLTKSIKNGKEFKDKKTGNNYLIKSNNFYYNGNQYTFSIIENNNKLKKIEEKLKYDEATKVLNKDSIMQVIDNYILNKDNDISSLAITVCDIDFFKKINDTYSHLAGDEVLKLVAKVFKEFMNKYDNFIVGRFGGDEFVFIIKNMSSTEINLLINDIKNKIENIEIEFNNKKISITMSFGIYIANNIDNFKFSSFNDIISKRMDLFNFADEALYESKNKGRNMITIFPNEKNLE